MLKRLAIAFALFSALAMAGQSPILQPFQTFVSTTGQPCSGCLLYSYAAGTTTPQATYTDSSGGTPNTNPVVLNTAGGAQVWMGTSAYKFVLTTATGSTIWTVDNVKTTVTSVAVTVPSWLTVSGSPITGSGTIAITAASGQTQNLFIATPNGAPGAVGLRSLVAADLPATIGPATLFLTSAEFDNGTCTTAKTIAPANGNKQKVTLTNAQTCALTFTQPASGTATVQVKIIQSAVSTFNGGISGCKWPGGAAPTITQTTGAIDILSVYLDGTNAYCQIAQAFS